jgi:surface antigen
MTAGMFGDRDIRSASLIALPLVAALSVALLVPAVAQPPEHAPAYGYRAKYRSQTGYEWELDYGVHAGTCDRRAVATALGVVTGAVIANQVADSDNRTVATLIGAVTGALIGNRIGRNFDEADEACVGHALELGKTGQPVTWTNEATGVRYQVILGADRDRNDAACREFHLTAIAGSERYARRGLACEAERGLWQVVE